MRQRNLQLVLALAGIAGMVALFLPFTVEISPVDAIFDKSFWGRALWELALPFFLTIPILVASMRLAMTNSLSKLESAIAYILGGTTIGIWVFRFATGVAYDRDIISDPSEWLSLALMIAPFLLGIALLVRDLRKNHLLAYRPIFALQVAYLGNLIWCLIIASDFGWQTGAYLSLVTAVTYLIQIGLAYSHSRRSPSAG